MGRVDEADAKLDQAIKIDPQNQSAFYYENLVIERRYNIALENRNVDSRSRMLGTSKGLGHQKERQQPAHPEQLCPHQPDLHEQGAPDHRHELNLIRVDQLTYQGLPLSEVVKNLYDEAKKRDPEKKGINFLVDLNSGQTTGGASIPPPARKPRSSRWT